MCFLETARRSNMHWLFTHWAFAPMGHFLDYWGIRIMSCWNNMQSPACHPQTDSTQEWNRLCCHLPWCVSRSSKAPLCWLTKLLSELSLFGFPAPACRLPGISCLCFLNDACNKPHYTTRSQELRLIRLWAHPESQWAPESKTLCSAWHPVCLHCNYPGCSSAMVDTRTHRGFTMEKTNKDAHLCQTMDSKPSSPIVLFVMISWTIEESQTRLTQVTTSLIMTQALIFWCTCTAFCSPARHIF